jgi:hypothetical protein
MQSLLNDPQSSFTQLFQILFFCLESFYSNTYVAVSCLCNLFTNVSPYEYSTSKYNSIIKNAVENSQSKHLVSTLGVWICTFFCLNALLTVTTVLFFPVIGLTMWWLFLWSAGYFVREKYPMILSKLGYN